MENVLDNKSSKTTNSKLKARKKTTWYGNV